MFNKILVTGSAGFIGFHTAKNLLESGLTVLGIDNLDPYYSVRLKEARLKILQEYDNYHHITGDIESDGELLRLFESHRPDGVIHLAAQAGVRYSIENPECYLKSNVIGTYKLLDAARQYPPKHLIMASTSSVYGANTEMPFVETTETSTPMSFYAATKKATEAFAHSYANVYGLPITMFRFFTVYGPWGRPDMALQKFAELISCDKPIQIYNHGSMRRDFTYVEDLVMSIVRLMHVVPKEDGRVPGDSLSPVAPFRIVNIGNGAPRKLMDFISVLEQCLGKEARKEYLPMQMGDVPATHADISLLKNLTGYSPHTPVEVGVKKFVEWFENFKDA